MFALNKSYFWTSLSTNILYLIFSTKIEDYRICTDILDYWILNLITKEGKWLINAYRLESSYIISNHKLILNEDQFNKFSKSRFELFFVL